MAPMKPTSSARVRSPRKGGEDFFFLEADLLDEREYDRWLELLTEDIVYWMPMRKNVSYANRHEDITAENDVAWFHDDKDTLRKRVKQIQTGLHWADLRRSV